MVVERSLAVNFFLPVKRSMIWAMQTPSGFCIPPHILQAAGPKMPSALRPLATKATALPIGPPWSMDMPIPMAAPKTRPPAPWRLVRVLVMRFMNQLTGTPMTYHMSREVMTVPRTGISRIGKTELTSEGTFLEASLRKFTT